MSESGVGVLVFGPESCGDGDPVPGVAAPMNSPYGIQRCDVCRLYPGDEEAARAFAAVMMPGAVVRRLDGDPSADYCIEVNGEPVDLLALLAERDAGVETA